MLTANTRRQSGFTLVELAITLAIILTLAALAVPLLTRYVHTQAVQATGMKLTRVGRAADAYVRAHYSTLDAPGAGVSEIPFATLVAEGFLPGAISPTSTFGQTYRIYAWPSNGQTVTAMVFTTGGEGAGDKHFTTHTIPAVAKAAGANGGFCSSGVIAGEPRGWIIGAYGDWKLAPSQVPAGVSIPTPGHLVWRAYYDPRGELGSDLYLYRNQQANPDLNTMHTAIRMDGNDISEAGDITAKGVTLGSSASGSGSACTNCAVSVVDPDTGRRFDMIGAYTSWEGLRLAAKGDTKLIVAGSPDNPGVSLAATGDVRAGANPNTGKGGVALSEQIQYSRVSEVTTASPYAYVPVPDCSAFSGAAAHVYVSPEAYLTNTDASSAVGIWPDVVRQGSRWRVGLQVLVPGDGWVRVKDGYLQATTRCVKS